jgi:UDP-glucose 4-epimerase
MPHALVTGGAGFIGSHIVDALIARGWKVSIVDDFSTGDRGNLNAEATLYEMDVNDAATLVRELRPDLISHHAAQISVRTSVADPAADAERNIVASLRLSQAAAETKVKRFVFASTGGAIYGEPIRVPQDEEHPQRPLSPYGCAKLSVEHYLEYFRAVHGLSCVALRYANVYGPRQNAHGEAGVVAIFAERLLRGDEAVINGDGEQTRDFVYVSDVVDANLAAAEAEWQGSFNVGTGVETSINELYAAMAAAAGVDRPARHAEAKAGEQTRSVIDGSRLRALAKLPEPVALRDGIARTVEWFVRATMSR